MELGGDLSIAVRNLRLIVEIHANLTYTIRSPVVMDGRAQFLHDKLTYIRDHGFAKGLVWF